MVRPVKDVEISRRRVGPGAPCFVIAEAGVNHNGSLETALELVDAAAATGADAVKFQTFDTGEIVTTDAPRADYQTRATGSDASQSEMLRSLELARGAYPQLLARCRDRGIVFLSTPFDRSSADFLDILGMPAFKIPSGELTNWPFLEHVARLGKPIIMSTGMATLDEVLDAVGVVRRAGQAQIVLLHCLSAYPAAPGEVNLRAMHTMAAACGLPVGYSDHTLGLEVSLAAVALGACVVEKHLTLSRAMPGPDHQASLEPGEFTALVRDIRNVEASLGDGRKVPAPSEIQTAAVARRSLVAAVDIAAGTTLTGGSIAVKRPGTGLPPSMLPRVIGRTARVAIARGALLTLDLLA